MAKIQEIGPYSAYAIAVKYGYKGTEEEWVQEQEANRKAAEAAAAAAAQSAKDAAASASGVAQSGQQAVQSIKDAQTAAEQAIDTAKQQAVQAAQAEAEKAATSAGQAASSAAEAAQSATNAAAEVGKVQSAGTSAVQAVQAAQNTATEAVSAAQQTATQAVSQAQTAAVSAVQEAGTTQTSAVSTAASSALSGIADAKDAALSDVAQAGAEQVSAVGTAGTSAVQDVNDAKTAALEAIDAANAALPSPTQSDAGKVPTVKADGSAYELAGPYAPLNAAIRPTASGNPVNITDSVEWPLLGLKVYGKSTQVTTTGAQLLNVQNKIQTINGVTMNCDGGIAHFTGELTSPDATFWFIGKYYGSDVVFTLPQGEYFISDCKMWDDSHANFSGKVVVPEDGMNVTGVSYTVSQTGAIDFVLYPMINAGSTAKPWEPYTGGQPSPSPDYPQEIHSAGESGSITVTVTDGADQSQSLTISTPNGLPGILVDSGGNYTDASGQQWFCDEIDYARGVYVQRVATFVIYSSYINLIENFKESVNTFSFLASLLPYPAISAKKLNRNFGAVLCNIAPPSKSDPYSSNEVGCGYTSNSNFLRINMSNNGVGESIESFKEYLDGLQASGTPAKILYIIDTPIETPLSEEEIAAHKALHTYDGTTVVSTAEDVAGIEVRYVADGEKYIDRKISEAIASADATQLASYDALSGAIHEGVNEA